METIAKRKGLTEMLYISHYSDKTFLKLNELPNHDDIVARSNAIRQYGLICVGEAWKPGYGKSAVYETVLKNIKLDQDTLNLLCLQEFHDPKNLNPASWF